MYGFLSNFLFFIFKLDSYFLFKLKGYFLYFTPIVHSMPKLRIHFRLVLIIYWFISLHTCCCLARILRCSLLISLWNSSLHFSNRYIYRTLIILSFINCLYKSSELHRYYNLHNRTYFWLSAYYLYKCSVLQKCSFSPQIKVYVKYIKHITLHDR